MTPTALQSAATILRDAGWTVTPPAVERADRSELIRRILAFVCHATSAPDKARRDANKWIDAAQDIDHDTWMDMSDAPCDDTEIELLVPAREGLRGFIARATYHPDGGYCVDELRNPCAWRLPNGLSVQPASDAPPDVAVGQVWRSPYGQRDYRVVSVKSGRLVYESSAGEQGAVHLSDWNAWVHKTGARLV